MKNSQNSDYILTAIALGSNLGNSQETLNLALETIAKTEGITLKKYSSFYQTAPIGPKQPDYVNACALLETTLTPYQLLETLQKIEYEFGRVRLERWGARTLDLDIIIYGDLILNEPDLIIPHLLMSERAFVLVPLAEIGSDLIEPKSGLTVKQLLANVDQSGVNLIN